MSSRKITTHLVLGIAVETTVVVAVPAGAGQDKPRFCKMSLGCRRKPLFLLDPEKHF